MFYSATTGGFYLPEIHTSLFEKDANDNYTPIGEIANAVEITDERHRELLEMQSQGKIISSDANGVPILIDPPEPEPETYDVLRERAILAEWPVTKQLEAITENLENSARSTKITELSAFIQSVKTQYPKP